MNPIIAPSLLAADFGHLEEAIQLLNQSQADWIHVDVMDGVFVPNISFGFPIMEVLQQHATKPLDVHLMIVEPQNYISRFAESGAHLITVHYEACTHLHRTIQQIKDAGCKAGVALNPHSPVSLLADCLQDLDLVLIMSVNPGFGGQQFIPHTLQKIMQLQQLKAKYQPDLIIEVDGGIGLGNYESVLEAGANALVAGSSVFSAPDPKAVISTLKQMPLQTKLV